MPTSEPIAAGDPPVPHVIVDPAKYDSCVTLKTSAESELDRSPETVPSRGEDFAQDDEEKREIDSPPTAKRSTRTSFADLTSVRIPT